MVKKVNLLSVFVLVLILCSFMACSDSPGSSNSRGSLGSQVILGPNGNTGSWTPACPVEWGSLFLSDDTLPQDFDVYVELYSQGVSPGVLENVEVKIFYFPGDKLTNSLIANYNTTVFYEGEQSNNNSKYKAHFELAQPGVYSFGFVVNDCFYFNVNDGTVIYYSSGGNIPDNTWKTITVAANQ